MEAKSASSSALVTRVVWELNLGVEFEAAGEAI
jgi:hypothetical protein